MQADRAPFAIVEGEEFAGPQDLCLAHRTLKQKYAALLAIAEGAEADRADARRLDWLAAELGTHGTIVARRYGPGRAGCELFTVSSQHVRGIGLRAAIDAALAGAVTQGEG
jgi:hypothetical protein